MRLFFENKLAQMIGFAKVIFLRIMFHLLCTMIDIALHDFGLRQMLFCNIYSVKAVSYTHLRAHETDS